MNEPRRVARAVVVPPAMSLATYAIDHANKSQDFDLGQFLWYLISTAGAGAVVYGIIQYAEFVLHTTLAPTIKFYAAVILSYIVPTGAYLGLVQLHLLDWSVALLVGTIATGYQVSQTVHWEVTP